jgi:hypothetical protein
MARKKEVFASTKTSIIEEKEIEVTWHCPKRGWITEKVKGARYAPLKYVPQLTRIDMTPSLLDETEGLEIEDGG